MDNCTGLVDQWMDDRLDGIGDGVHKLCCCLEISELLEFGSHDFAFFLLLFAILAGSFTYFMLHMGGQVDGRSTLLLSYSCQDSLPSFLST